MLGLLIPGYFLLLEPRIEVPTVAVTYLTIGVVWMYIPVARVLMVLFGPIFGILILYLPLTTQPRHSNAIVFLLILLASIAIGLAVLGEARPPFEIPAAPMPELLPPEQLERNRREIPISGRFDLRFLPGHQPFSGSEHGSVAGWIRLDEPQVLDYILLAAYTDSFPPALFSMLDASSPLEMPTVELTRHFHAALPRPQDRADDYCLARMRSKTSHQGFVVEDAEIWSRDAQLLARSRQLAAVVRE